jgi:hypothetical protein
MNPAKARTDFLRRQVHNGWRIGRKPTATFNLINEANGPADQITYTVSYSQSYRFK